MRCFITLIPLTFPIEEDSHLWWRKTHVSDVLITDHAVFQGKGWTDAPLPEALGWLFHNTALKIRWSLADAETGDGVKCGVYTIQTVPISNLTSSSTSLWVLSVPCLLCPHITFYSGAQQLNLGGQAPLSVGEGDSHWFCCINCLGGNLSLIAMHHAMTHRVLFCSLELQGCGFC